MNRLCSVFRFLIALLCFSTPSLHAQWVHIKTPLDYDCAECCFAVSADSAGGTNIFAGTWGAGVFLSTDNGTSWAPVNFGLTCPFVDALAVDADSATGTNLFAGTYGGGVFLSTNNGKSWSGVNASSAGSQSLQQSALLVKGLAVGSSDNGGPHVFARTGAGIFLTTDRGASWTVASSAGDNGPLTVINGTLFSGTDGGVSLSTNEGTSWTAVNSGLTYPYINAFAAAPNRNGGVNLFAGTYGAGVFLSTNSGKNWTQANTGLMNVRYPFQNADLVNALAVYDTLLFAGTGSGIYLSTNNGSSWRAGGLNGSFVLALALSPDGAGSMSLFAGIHGGGIWRRQLSDLLESGDNPAVSLPAHFTLEQNYPNPFNPSTTISFSIPTRATVSLKVYDVLGREVSTIISEELPPGTYSRKWTATRLSSGVYFYRLRAGSFSETKKFIVLG
ncbi:MAG TPA: T9SS type A sorting domain-containing protein [Bacteroidota bacterium]|nr:T9SS type A sorting domain-containing protein [Bacteroidota bacterium]